MQDTLNKETASKLMAMKGEVRGIALKSHQEFIMNEKGEAGLKALEDEMASLGYPIKYKDIEINFNDNRDWKIDEALQLN